MSPLWEKLINESLESVLVKSFNLSRRAIRVPEYRSRNKRSYYHPMTTWARKPHNHVSKIVFQELDSTSAKELERGFLQAVGSDTNL